MKNFLIGALVAAMTLSFASVASAQFGADVGFSKFWVEKDAVVTSVDGAVPAVTFQHAYAYVEGPNGEQIPERGVQFGYANLASGSSAGEVNSVWGQYFAYYKGMNACLGVQGNFLEAGDLVSTTTSVVGARAALQFPAFIADELPFQVSGHVGWDVHGDNVLTSSLFLGFTGTL